MFGLFRPKWQVGDIVVYYPDFPTEYRGYKFKITIISDNFIEIEPLDNWGGVKNIYSKKDFNEKFKKY